MIDDMPVSPTADNNDPWGQPYRITKSTENGLIVASNGPNQTTPDSGFDHDDIYSNMDRSPIETIYRYKRWRLMAALSMPVIWLVGTIAYLTFTVQRNGSLAQSAG
jgi:hypothetical protein